MKCVLIKTNDRREFFTKVENYQKLAEFSRVFSAELSIVNIKEGEILSMKNLVPAICNASYKPTIQPQYEEVKMRKRMPSKTYDEIRSYILTTFVTGRIVSLKDVTKRFKKKSVSTSTLWYHISKIRKELARRGKTIEKIGAGSYQMVD